MARLTLLFFSLACFLLITVGAKKHHKVKHHKPQGDFYNHIDKVEKLNDLKTAQLKENRIGSDSDTNDLKNKWKKAKHGKYHKKIEKLQKKMPWLHILSVEDCDFQCAKRELCIMGPLDVKPMCVHVKDLKRSKRLFHKFQKKQKKAWKRFQRKNYSHQKTDLNDAKNRVKSNIWGKEKKMAMMKRERLNDNWVKEMARMEKERQNHIWEKEEMSHMMKKNQKDFWDKEKIALRNKKRAEEDIFGDNPTSFDDDEMPPFVDMDMKPKEAGDSDACTSEEYSQMRTRINGWFHLLHSTNKDALMEERDRKAHKHSVKKQLEVYGDDHCECMDSAMWEFGQMDTNSDSQLTMKEMDVLEKNSNEPCIRPYLTSCDKDYDGKLSSEEWCCCFSNVVAPCFLHMDDIKASSKPVTYMPRCDREGYYMAEQCDAAKKVCWCTDFNGNMMEGTKTDGRADCSKYTKL